MRCREKNVRDEEGVIDEDRSVVGRPFVTVEKTVDKIRCECKIILHVGTNN